MHLQVQLTTGSSSPAVSVIDYTHIDFDSAASSSCTMQTTAAQQTVTTSQQMDDVSNSTTEAIINGKHIQNYHVGNLAHGVNKSAVDNT